MCGRTSSYTPPDRLAEIFGAELGPDVEAYAGPSFNIAPTRNLYGLVVPATPATPATPGTPGTPGTPAASPSSLPGDVPPSLVLGSYRWGLVPPWSKDLSQGSRLFNARAETLSERPLFKKAFASRRLAVVVDGFFEWEKGPSRQRQPYYFHRQDDLPLTFAGLWERWKDDEAGVWVRSCTIITTKAGPDVKGVHDRMPVVLEREQLQEWLSPGTSCAERLSRFLAPAPGGTLVAYPVDQKVGNVRNDGPELLEAIAEED